MPARMSSGTASDRMRPLGTAMTRGCAMAGLYLCTCEGAMHPGGPAFSGLPRRRASPPHPPKDSNLWKVARVSAPVLRRSGGGMADEAGNREAFRIQEFYCRNMDAP